MSMFQKNRSKISTKTYSPWFILAFAALSAISLSATDFPKIIDFGKLSTPETFSDEVGLANESKSWEIGYYAFNTAPELTPFFAYLNHHYKIDAVVETGTHLGNTTVLFSHLFKEVHTIEIDPEAHRIAREKLAPFSNVTCHFGPSDLTLQTLLPNLEGKRILFYLDAHTYPHLPLLEELREIYKTHSNHCILVINNFKVPDRNDIPHEFYGNKKQCSYSYIKYDLHKKFPNYTVHYLIPKSVNSRAKFIAIPKAWQ